ncbi:lactate utilization protein C [Micromonospora sp. NBC_01412]|uniref:LutC/YkgG family protein n=1 Tax=Micromonospora sp. NBC_01412 TaxID=2903590 RepID=UPI0032472FCC
MNARDTVLARLRAATAGSAAVEAPRGYRRRGDLPPGHPDLLDLLVERLTDYRAVVHRAPAGRVGATVAAVLAGEEARRVVVPPGLPGGWLPPAVDAVRDAGLGTEALDAVDAVVTGAAVAIAETGTIVLDGSPDQGRRVLTLLPDLHVCVVARDRVVGTVPEALSRLAPDRPLTWISGPSATSDIEFERVEGVHGPRRLHVVVEIGH